MFCSKLKAFSQMFGLAALLVVPASQAALITNAGGGLDLTLVTDTSDPTIITSFDIRGDLIADVADGGGSLGLIGLTDGPLIGDPAASAPNVFLLGVNAVPATEAGFLTFDPASIFFSGSGVLFSTTFTPLTTLTNNALMVLANSQSITFGFTFDSVIAANSTTNLTTTLWRFSSAQTVDAPGAIPEPATLTLFGLGLIGVFAVGRRRRRS